MGGLSQHRGEGGHIEEQQGLSQSRRLPEPPIWPPQPLIGCCSKVTGAPVALLCQGASLSAPGLGSCDRRCFRLRVCVCVVFFSPHALKSPVQLVCVATVLGARALAPFGSQWAGPHLITSFHRCSSFSEDILLSFRSVPFTFSSLISPEVGGESPLRIKHLWEQQPLFFVCLTRAFLLAN